MNQLDWKWAQAPLNYAIMAQRFNSPDEAEVFHYVTLNVRDRHRPFKQPYYARLAIEELRCECDRHPAALSAYVVMPDHLHFLVQLEDGGLRRFLARYKPGVTLKLDALAAARGNEKARDWLSSKGKRELWQDGKHSLPVYSRSWLQQKIAYIHNNPVRAGLVVSPAGYPWSSYGAYVPDAGHVVPVKVNVVRL